MNTRNEFAVYMSEEQRHRILEAVVRAYYADLDQTVVIFDTNRGWCGILPGLVRLFPDARVLCCVRSPAWILDSAERYFQGNALQASQTLGFDLSATVYERVDALIKGNFLGSALNAFRQAWFGDHAKHLVTIRYDSLVERPAEIVARLYALLGEEPVVHDFNNLAYDAPEFDARLGAPGFHRVAPRVEPKTRQTILPPDLFEQHDCAFWDSPDRNPRNVIVW